MLGVGAMTAIPTLAGAESKLAAARDRLESARQELDQRHAGVAGDARRRLAQAQDAIAESRSKIEESRGRSRAGSATTLNDRVAAAFMSGGSRSIGALLTSDSIQDAADRLQYTQSVVQGDADLATEVAVMAEELRRQENRLRDSARKEEMASEQLARHRADPALPVRRPRGLWSPTSRRNSTLSKRSRSGLGPVDAVVRSGAIQTCPAAGPNSFVDSFGDPRPGGRTHMGIDLMAPLGTPVVAVAPGTAHSAGSIGGLGAVVEHPNGGLDVLRPSFLVRQPRLGVHRHGDRLRNGDHVHFEYHPNGGAAVNPYSMLLAVC